MADDDDDDDDEEEEVEPEGVVAAAMRAPIAEGKRMTSEQHGISRAPGACTCA